MYDEKLLMDIFLRLSNGEREAFDELYQNYYKLVFGVAMSVLKKEEDSADVVQNVFLKIYTLSADRFPKSAPLSWLYTVSKNEALQVIRKEKRMPFDGTLPDFAGDSGEIETVIDREAYRSLIRSLPSKEQEIVTLKVIGGFTYKEIAKLLHIPMGTVQWKYYTAVHKLKIIAGNLVAFVIFGAAAVWSLIQYNREPLAGSVAVPESSVPLFMVVVLTGIAVLLGISLACFLKKFWRNPTK